MTTRWNPVSEDTLTGFSDKNEWIIGLGDTLRYKRKVKAEKKWLRDGTNTVITIPGHYEFIEVQVVGFARIVRKHWKRGFEFMEYLQVKESNNPNIFRIYRTDLVETI